jgi:enoyl-CoA hydratase
MEYLLLEKKGNIGYLTINRPKQLNALSSAVLDELDQAVTTLETDDEIRVVIITGAGEKAFVAGADVKELHDAYCAAAIAFNRKGSQIFRRLEKMGKPVIAAINGFALGGGLELALACDIRIAAENAKFSNPETGLGQIPGFGATQRLPRLVGTGMAKEIIFTGRMIKAPEALAIGLVNRVVPVDELMSTCEEMANMMLTKSQPALASAKKVIDEGIQMSLDEGLQLEWYMSGPLHETEEQKAFTQAFLDKSNKKK